MPVVDRAFDLPGLSAVVGEELGLRISTLRELLFKYPPDAGVQLLAAGFEQGTVSGVLDLRVLK